MCATDIGGHKGEEPAHNSPEDKHTYTISRNILHSPECNLWEIEMWPTNIPTQGR